MSWTPGWLTGSRVLATEWAPWIKSIETLVEAEAAGDCWRLAGMDSTKRKERKEIWVWTRLGLSEHRRSFSSTPVSPPSPSQGRGNNGRERQTEDGGRM